MESLGDRVKAEREAKEWSQQRLAEEVSRLGFKIGQSAIGNIEANRVKEPKCIVQLAQALNKPARWLQSGKGPRELGEATPGFASSTQQNSNNVVSGPLRRIRTGDTELSPLILWKSVLGERDRLGVFLLSKQPDGGAERPDFLQFAGNAFAIRVITRDNEPVFKLRDTLLVNPDDAIDDGDDCVFTGDPTTSEPAHSLVGQLVRKTGALWIIRQYAAKADREVLVREFPNAWRIVGRYYRR